MNVFVQVGASATAKILKPTQRKAVHTAIIALSTLNTPPRILSAKRKFTTVDKIGRDTSDHVRWSFYLIDQRVKKSILV